MSTSRVAELIGRTPGTVRAWERGTSVPADASVLSALAAVLDLDEGVVFRAVGMEAPVTETSPTVEQSLRTLTAGARATSPPEAPAQRAAPPRPREALPPPSPMPAVPAVPVTDRPRREMRSAETKLRAGDVEPTPVVKEPAPMSTTTTPTTPGRRRRVEEPRGWLESLRAATVRRPVSAPPPSTLPPAPPAPSYLEDPSERLSYKLRSLYTLVGIVALFLVLAWALPQLFDALGTMWSVLTENL